MGGKKARGPKKGKGPGGVIERIMRDVGMRGKPAVLDLTSGTGGSRESGNPASSHSEGQLSTTPTIAASLALSAAPSRPGNTVALPAGLQLCHVKSVGAHKDAYLYYFLRRHPGRTIVFTNSIDQTRRLAQLLSLLRLPARALHAKMQQRARLKSLDCFRAQRQAVLVATDVAARGLDIPLVEHVIHYDMPRSLEVFVHRAGRTARANREGLSFSMVAPRDEKFHDEVCRALFASSTSQRPEDPKEASGGSGAGILPFPVDLQELNATRERVHLAGKIVGHEQETGRQQATQSWFLKRAREADLDLDEELLNEKEHGTEKERQRSRQMEMDRKRLNELLSQPMGQQRRKFINVADSLQALAQTEECKDAIKAVSHSVRPIRRTGL
jgi:ATP-dependent RNA helicase DDX24/MAK5